MSYDVTFGEHDIVPGTIFTRADGAVVGEPQSDNWRNYTSNVSPMWTKAIGENLGDLIERVGSRAGDLLPHLERGIATMQANPDEYADMNPSNGWGNSEGALAFLVWMRDNCRAFPDTTVSVWR